MPHGGVNIGTWIFTPGEIDHASRKFGVDGAVTLLANGSRIEAGAAVYIEDKGVGLAQRAELIDPRLRMIEWSRRLAWH